MSFFFWGGHIFLPVLPKSPSALKISLSGGWGVGGGGGRPVHTHFVHIAWVCVTVHKHTRATQTNKLINDVIVPCPQMADGIREWESERERERGEREPMTTEPQRTIIVSLSSIVMLCTHTHTHILVACLCGDPFIFYRLSGAVCVGCLTLEN